MITNEATSIRRSMHLNVTDMKFLSEKERLVFLENKFIIDMEDNKASESPIEEFFSTMRDSCKHFYHVSSPEKKNDRLVYYIYFSSKDDVQRIHSKILKPMGKELSENDIIFLDNETKRNMLNNKFALTTLEDDESDEIECLKQIRAKYKHYFYIGATVISNDNNYVTRHIYFENAKDAEKIKSEYLSPTKELVTSDLECLRDDIKSKLLQNKFIVRTNEEKRDAIFENYKSWLRENCESFFYLGDKKYDKGDSVFYIYFEDQEEAKLFKLTF